MKVKTNQLADRITAAIGPIFQEDPEYSTILDAMCLVMARVIQGTPEGGSEFEVMDYASHQIAEALDKYLEIERNAVTPAMEAVEGFSAFAGDHPHLTVLP